MWELNPGVPPERHRPKYLSYHLLPAKIPISRKLELEAEIRHKVMASQDGIKASQIVDLLLQ